MAFVALEVIVCLESNSDFSFEGPRVSELRIVGSRLSGLIAGASDLKGGESVSDDSSASSWDSKLWKDGCCVPNSVSGASDLIEVESVSDGSNSVSAASDFIEVEYVSGGSESRSLAGVVFAFFDAESGSLSFVFTVVESLAGLMVTELGRNISEAPSLVSVSSDLMGGEFVSDESFVV